MCVNIHSQRPVRWYNSYVKHQNTTYINPLLLLFILGCIAMPQVSPGFGRTLRVPPGIVLQINTAESDEQYSEMHFGFSPIEGVEDSGMMLLVPGSIMELPDGSRGCAAGPGLRRWELVLRMN